MNAAERGRCCEPPEDFDALGNLSFGPELDPPIKGPKWEDWFKRARDEYRLMHFTAWVLNSDDKELFAKIESRGKADEFMKICEALGDQRKVHLDSAKVMEAAEFRLLVVLKRWDDRNPESSS